jgi:hypothetical protein
MCLLSRPNANYSVSTIKETDKTHTQTKDKRRPLVTILTITIQVVQSCQP